MRLDTIENAVDRRWPSPPRVDRVGDQAENTLALKPTAGRRVLAVAKRIEKDDREGSLTLVRKTPAPLRRKQDL